MRPHSEAAWLQGLDSRTEQERRDESWGVTTPATATERPDGVEPPF